MWFWRDGFSFLLSRYGFTLTVFVRSRGDYSITISFLHQFLKVNTPVWHLCINPWGGNDPQTRLIQHVDLMRLARLECEKFWAEEVD